MSIKKLVHRGFLVKPEGLHIKVGIDLKNVRTEMGDFKKASLRKVMLSEKAIGIVVATIKRFAENRRGIVFGVDISHSELLKDAIVASGFTCDVVHSKVTSEERCQRLEDFASGKLQFIVNPMILTEGYDCPRADCMINAAPTKNRSLYIQKAGRVLRTHPGKENALLIDFGKTKEKHKLMTALDLIGRDITMKTVRDYDQLYPPSLTKKADSADVALASSNEKYDPLGRSHKVTPISDHDNWGGGVWPREPVSATEKQKDFIRKLSKSTNIAVPFLDTMGIKKAKNIIGNLIKESKRIQAQTPITGKQIWCLKKMVAERHLSEITEDMIYNFSKRDAQVLIGKLKAQGE